MDAGSRLGGSQGVVAEKGGQTQSSDERAHGCGRAGPVPPTPEADWAGARAWWPRKAARRSRPTRGPMGVAGPGPSTPAPEAHPER